MTTFSITRPFLIALLTSCFFFSSFLKGASTSAAPASSTIQSKENPGSLPILLGLDHVAKDLHLTSLQKTVIGGLRSDYRAAALKITQAGHATSAETAILQLKLDRLADDYNDRATAALNHSQKHRLREIERQILGGTLLTSPSEQQFLGMSDQQKKKIARLHQESEQKASVIQHQAVQGKLNYHQQIMALRKNRQHYATAMLKVLNPTQLQQWRAAQGPKLVF
ncbi:MAG: hypothetical protein K2W99_00705 [Chthoniobacterales bacterium]|nr:hypothetical protein [Chthoniobacterales bacterium]